MKMLSVGELLSIFSELSVDNKKNLYNFLIKEFSNVSEEKKVEFLKLLEDLKEDLLYYDEEDLNEKNNEIYLTQKELSAMFGISVRHIQRILKKESIKPVNEGQRPLLYNLENFEKYYFSNKRENMNNRKRYFYRKEINRKNKYSHLWYGYMRLIFQTHFFNVIIK